MAKKDIYFHYIHYIHYIPTSIYSQNYTETESKSLGLL